MSTKATLAHGSHFHLYREVLDEDFIYLELEGVPFTASYNRVTVPIPVHIWEVIRRHEGADLSWADKTDEQLLQHVEQAVDERIERYRSAETEESRRLIVLLGAIPYGRADEPRGEQIARGVAYFRHRREHQQQIKQAIEALESVNSKR
jgi:hypothetical protein